MWPPPVIELWCAMRDGLELKGTPDSLAEISFYDGYWRVAQLCRRHDLPRELLDRVAIAFRISFPGEDAHAQAVIGWDGDLHPRYFAPFAATMR